MKEIQQFFNRHFITAPISFGSWLIFILGMGMNAFAATGLLIAIYFRRYIFDQADSIILQFKKTRDVPI